LDVKYFQLSKNIKPDKPTSKTKEEKEDKMETEHISELLLISVVLLSIGLLPSAAQAEWETVIPGNSMTPANFDTYWEWFYPWGDTLNGSAKMYVEQVTLNTNGTATIVAEMPNPESKWKYRSGAFNSKTWVICNDQYPEWDIKGELRAPIMRGTWSVFWITGASPWTAEVDILEYKGNAFYCFNTYDGGWETKKSGRRPFTFYCDYECGRTIIKGSY